MMSGDTSNIPGLDSILRGEIMRKDALINQLVNQNKEMLSAKERQDIELTAQRETLQVIISTCNLVRLMQPLYMHTQTHSILDY